MRSVAYSEFHKGVILCLTGIASRRGEVTHHVCLLFLWLYAVFFLAEETIPQIRQCLGALRFIDRQSRPLLELSKLKARSSNYITVSVWVQIN